MIKHILKNGLEITIEITEYCQQIFPEIKDSNGKIIASGNIVKADDYPKLRGKVPTGYYIIGNVLLSPEKGLEVIAAIETKKAEYAATPEGIKARLRKERQSLVDDINGALDEADRAKAKSYESGEGTGQFVFAGKEWEEKAEVARAKLAEFDKAHPEIIAGIKAERAEEAQKHIWD